MTVSISAKGAMRDMLRLENLLASATRMISRAIRIMARFTIVSSKFAPLTPNSRSHPAPPRNNLSARKLPVDRAQEAEKLLMPVPLVKVANDFSLKQVEGGKQGGGSVPFVVVGHGAAAALFERQTGLGPIQRLYLAFLVDAKHDGLVRRVQVEPDHVGKFFQKAGVAGELEGLGAMRLEVVAAQDVIDRRLTHALIGGQGSTTPMRAPFGLRLQGCVDDRLDALRAVGRFASAAGCDLPQPLQALSGKPVPPQSNRLAVDLQQGGDAGFAFTTGGSQHNPASQRHLLRCSKRRQPALDLLLLLLRNGQRRTRSRHNQVCRDT